MLMNLWLRLMNLDQPIMFTVIGKVLIQLYYLCLFSIMYKMYFVTEKTRSGLPVFLSYKYTNPASPDSIFCMKKWMVLFNLISHEQTLWLLLGPTTGACREEDMKKKTNTVKTWNTPLGEGPTFAQYMYDAKLLSWQYMQCHVYWLTWVVWLDPI